MPHWAYAAVPTVASVDDMRDILDIEGPVRLPFDWTPVWWALAVAALLACAVWLYILRKRRLARRQAAAVSPPSPFEVFERELAALSGLGPGRAREFSFRLSLGMRGLMEAAAGIRALEMTTEELAPRLAGLSLDPALRRDLEAALRRADMVKFAGQAARAGDMRTDLDCAARLLCALRPAPEAPETAGNPEKTGDAGNAADAAGGGR